MVERGWIKWTRREGPPSGEDTSHVCSSPGYSVGPAPRKQVAGRKPDRRTEPARGGQRSRPTGAGKGAVTTPLVDPLPDQPGGAGARTGTSRRPLPAVG